MSKQGFNLGDKLLILEALEGNMLTKNKVATVVLTVGEGTAARIGLSFKENVNGHTCDGCCDKGYGWFCDATDLMKYSTKKNLNKDNLNSKLTICVQDDTVTAELRQNDELVERAMARCGSDDVFDILVGAQIALNRLARKTDSKIILSKDIFKDVEFI